MKTRILLLMFFVVNYSFSQTINDYKAVVIPLKYDLQKVENEYRLQTITKVNLQKAGFTAFYSNDPTLSEFPDRCSLLYIDVKKDNGFLVTKLFIVFKDCYGKEIYQSTIGRSKEKEFEAAYVDALNDAFVSVIELEYAYNGNTNFTSTSVVAPMSAAAVASVPPPSTSVTETDVPATSSMSPGVGAAVVAVPVVAASAITNDSSVSKSSGTLYAQPTSYGYQLVDGEPKVVMKVYKTSNSDSYMAKKGDVQGALVSKNKEWFFEYYQNDKLVSEKIDVKF